MAWDINIVNIIGRLTNDIDLRYTAGGTAVATFSIAVNNKPKPNGENSASFFNCNAWGKTAENMANFCQKGKQIAILGHLQQDAWETPDGQKRQAVKIVVDRMQMLASPQGSAGNGRRNDINMDNGQNQQDQEFYQQTEFNQNPINPSDYEEQDMGF